MDFPTILSDPAAARALYAAIRTRIREQGIVGHDRAVARLCLAGVALLRGPDTPSREGSVRGRRLPQVITLVGPPGSAKTSLSLAFARALPAQPYCAFSAEAVSPMGWQGYTFDGDVLPQ